MTGPNCSLLGGDRTGAGGPTGTGATTGGCTAAGGTGAHRAPAALPRRAAPVQLPAALPRRAGRQLPEPAQAPAARPEQELTAARQPAPARARGAPAHRAWTGQPSQAGAGCPASRRHHRNGRGLQGRRVPESRAVRAGPAPAPPPDSAAASARSGVRRAACCSAAAAEPLAPAWECRRPPSFPTGPARGARCPGSGSCPVCGRLRPEPVRLGPPARRVRAPPSAAEGSRSGPVRCPIGRSVQRRQWTTRA